MNPERKLALTLAQECAIAESCTDTEEVVARAEKYLAFLSKPPLPGSFAQQPLKTYDPLSEQACLSRQAQQNTQVAGQPAAPGHDLKRWPR